MCRQFFKQRLKSIFNRGYRWFKSNRTYCVLFLFAIGYITVAARMFKGGNDAIIAGLGLLAGYVLTHVLEVERKRSTNKLNHYLDLVRGLRIFIMEEDLRKSGKLQDLRDRFQDAYFSSTILISADAYRKFRTMADAFKKFLECKTEEERNTTKSDFMNKQSALINALRKEFLSDDNIDFQTFDFRIGPIDAESFSSSSIPLYSPDETRIHHTLPIQDK